MPEGQLYAMRDTSQKGQSNMARANRGSRCQKTPQVKSEPSKTGPKFKPSVKLGSPKFKPSVRWNNPSF
jgi:hypothetical protein